VITLSESRLETVAPPDAVWAVWTDVASRPLWHPRLEWARLDGPLSVGARGAWKPRGARPVRVRVTEAVAGRRLVLEGTHDPPVARGHYEHEVIARSGGGSTIVHRMRLAGPLSRPLAAVLGRALGVFAHDAAVRKVAELATGDPAAAPPQLL
jgi:uncharacterized protein YndB with AHSA1/START domain